MFSPVSASGAKIVTIAVDSIVGVSWLRFGCDRASMSSSPVRQCDRCDDRLVAGNLRPRWSARRSGNSRERHSTLSCVRPGNAVRSTPGRTVDATDAPRPYGAMDDGIPAAASVSFDEFIAGLSYDPAMAKELPDGPYLVAVRLAFHWTVKLAEVGDASSYLDRWCFGHRADCRRRSRGVGRTWRRPGTMAPASGDRTPTSERRRLEGICRMVNAVGIRAGIPIASDADLGRNRTERERGFRMSSITHPRSGYGRPCLPRIHRRLAGRVPRRPGHRRMHHGGMVGAFVRWIRDGPGVPAERMTSAAGSGSMATVKKGHALEVARVVEAPQMGQEGLLEQGAEGRAEGHQEKGGGRGGKQKRPRPVLRRRWSAGTGAVSGVVGCFAAPRPIPGLSGHCLVPTCPGFRGLRPRRLVRPVDHLFRPSSEGRRRCGNAQITWIISEDSAADGQSVRKGDQGTRSRRGSGFCRRSVRPEGRPGTCSRGDSGFRRRSVR